MFEHEISIQILIEIEIINHRLNVFLLRNIRITYNIYIYVARIMNTKPIITLKLKSEFHN